MCEKKQLLPLQVLENRHLSGNTYLLRLVGKQRQTLPPMSAGQFVEVLPPGGKTLLRRPISICNVVDEGRELWLLVASVGAGTESIVSVVVGGELSVILPLGNRFSSEGVERPLLVGGGVGIAPMLMLARHFHSQGITADVLLGGRTEAQLVLLDEFERYGRVHLTTEDGSLGLRGRVTDHPVLAQSAHQRIYTCGPKPMMQAVARIGRDRKISCEVSLENTMACGIGACLCCVEDTKDRGHVCVCTDGPVFNSDILKW